MLSESELAAIAYNSKCLAHCIACLLEHFHLTPSTIARLTDTQIYKYYFHARDEHGLLISPTPPEEAEEEYGDPKADDLRHLIEMFGAGLITAVQYEELKAQIIERYQ